MSVEVAASTSEGLKRRKRQFLGDQNNLQSARDILKILPIQAKTLT